MSSYQRPVRIGRINTIGLFMLYRREVMRFMKIFIQTVGAPMTTAILFMAVFAVAVGDRINSNGDVPYVVFLGPGLVMMAALQNAFANTSSSIVVAKVQGNIVDLLMPPLGALEILIAMTAAGITRGVIVGAATALALWMLGSSGWPAHPLTAFLFLFLGSAVMALAGVMAGIWADKFDSLAAVTNFVVQPMVFLSGTFYSVDQLPAPFDAMAAANPVFHMIDGFRYGIIGQASFPPLTGALILLLVTLILGCICWRMLATGYKLKA
ncbi:ABC transporter permease [Alphaproteobacteria bacterium LSUCC0684]